MLSAIFGLGAVALGLWGMWLWSVDLIHFLKGVLPISLFFAGIIAIIAGLSNLSSKTPPGSKKGT
jgi:hypothetical protein